MTLLEYIEKQWTTQGKPINEIFKPGEWNEIVRLMYILLKRAILDGANSFTLSERRFYWSNNEYVLGERSLEEIRKFANVSPETTFKVILARDEMVRKHLHLIAENDKELTYQINNS